MRLRWAAFDRPLAAGDERRGCGGRRRRPCASSTRRVRPARSGTAGAARAAVRNGARSAAPLAPSGRSACRCCCFCWRVASSP
eukprot:1222841-Prymnesium_polylepis.1